MTNWERKSSYLLREIVKFRTYIDSLNAAQAQKDKIYAEREVDAGKNADVNGDGTQTQPLANELDGADEPPKGSKPITT